MDMRELVTDLLDRLADEARDAGRLERERDIATLGAQEAAAELDHFKLNVRQVSPAQIEALLNACARGMKINAIKEVRALTGMGLKDAKDLVERVYPPASPSSY